MNTVTIICIHCVSNTVKFYSLQTISLEIYTLLQKSLLDNDYIVDYFNVIIYSG